MNAAAPAPAFDALRGATTLQGSCWTPTSSRAAGGLQRPAGRGRRRSGGGAGRSLEAQGERRRARAWAFAVGRIRPASAWRRSDILGAAWTPFGWTTAWHGRAGERRFLDALIDRGEIDASGLDAPRGGHRAYRAHADGGSESPERGGSCGGEGTNGELAAGRGGGGELSMSTRSCPRKLRFRSFSVPKENRVDSLLRSHS